MSAPAITITIPVPTAYTVDQARLVAWLGSHGWVPYRDNYEGWYVFDKGKHVAAFSGRDEPRLIQYLREAVMVAAEAEGIEPHALAAQLGPEGPALQWAHMSDSARARPLAALDGAARAQRQCAIVARTFDDPEAALSHEGQALEHEAAAAVLRGGGR